MNGDRCAPAMDERLRARVLEALRLARVSSPASGEYVVILSPSGARVELRPWAARLLRSVDRELAHEVLTRRLDAVEVLVVAQDERGAVRVEVLELEDSR